ncbi:8-oxo-dGTP pyrophosphatase MutT (NUDIX family) [Streptosporangium becharense]|uniref:8-oxo-dGTP pyrophosphatase MutT (NUDIX family) n=1 Tax=Streptosporangium becharense TaxID=1816182 RepID=A0A7W9MKK1_9ACTN|nr:NUDIX hydrolase [Streptosporangium becharense]MBB2914290.1 8-oxo-dGTP pyrophosphatase MutT (NUDIX family) [Streptosporangium becharense]MBB5823678.1 8-oxo-dGTP pyrophosphatase MutT (NUDIX family) [Streptosporangium becharense]
MTDAHGPTIRTLASTVVYTNPWIAVREDRIERPDGSHGIYGVVDQLDFALVMPMEDDGFHLVEEYRYPVGRRTWNFPQGGVRDSPSPEATAHTELAEETGLRAASMVHLGRLDNAHGTSGQRFDVFLATGLTAGPHSREHTEQDMRQGWVSQPDLERMIREGTITDSCSIAAYALFLLHTRG